MNNKSRYNSYNNCDKAQNTNNINCNNHKNNTNSINNNKPRAENPLTAAKTTIYTALYFPMPLSLKNFNFETDCRITPACMCNYFAE